MRQLGQLQARFDEMEARNAAAVAVSADTKEELAGLHEDLRLRFPLVSDEPLAIAKDYGVRQADEDIALPALFVLDRDRRVAYAYVGRAPADRPMLDEVFEALERLDED